MERVYITVKRSNDRELPYHSKIARHESLHYGADGLLCYLADMITQHYITSKIIFRNNIPQEEGALRKTLDILIEGHNFRIRLGTRGQIPGQTEARKILRQAQ